MRRIRLRQAFAAPFNRGEDRVANAPGLRAQLVEVEPAGITGAEHLGGRLPRDPADAPLQDCGRVLDADVLRRAVLIGTRSAHCLGGVDNAEIAPIDDGGGHGGLPCGRRRAGYRMSVASSTSTLYV